MATAATISARLILDSSSYQSGLAQAQQMTQNFSSTMKNIGSNLTMIGGMASAAFTVPIVAGATAAVNAFNGLDTQMRNIQSITQQSDDSLEQLRQRFIAMSTDANVTRDSAQKLAEAFYFIQSAGFAGEEGMTVLQAATKAASAGLTDTMTAGNSILAVLNAYGLEASDATHVSDILFKTVDLGVLTFSDLATQLGDVVNTAHMSNISLEEMGAAIADITRKGVSPSEAVTALNQLLLQFISPSEKMKKAAEEVGFSLSVDTLRTYGLAGALDELIKKGGGTDILLTIFGDNVRALKGALSLAGNGTKEFTDLMAQFGDVSGRTNEAFATQMQANSAKWDVFINKGTALLLQLAAIFVPVLMELMDALTPVVDAIAKMDPETLKWIVVILALVAVLGPLLLFLGLIASAIGAIGTIIGAVGLPFIIILIGVLLILAVIVALAWVAWNNNWLGIRDKTEEYLPQILQRLGELSNWFTTTDWKGRLAGLLQDVMDWLHNLNEQTGGGLDLLSTLFDRAFSIIWILVMNRLNNLKLLVKAILQLIAGDFRGYGETWRQIWDNEFIALGDMVRVSLMDYRDMFLWFWNWVTNVIDWPAVGRSIIEGIGNGVKSATNALTDALIGAIDASRQATEGFFGINSPATKFFPEIGAMMAAGTGIGFQSMLPDAMSPVAFMDATMVGGTYGTSQPATTDSSSQIVELLQQLVQNSNTDEKKIVRIVREVIQQYKD